MQLYSLSSTHILNFIVYLMQLRRIFDIRATLQLTKLLKMFVTVGNTEQKLLISLETKFSDKATKNFVIVGTLTVTSFTRNYNF